MTLLQSRNRDVFSPFRYGHREWSLLCYIDVDTDRHRPSRAHLTIIDNPEQTGKLTDIWGIEMTKAKAERTTVIEEDIEATIESAKECPGEGAFIEAQ